MDIEVRKFKENKASYVSTCLQFRGASRGGDFVVEQPRTNMGIRKCMEIEFVRRLEGDIRSQEVSIIFTSDLARKVACSKLEFVPLWSLGRKAVGLLL